MASITACVACGSKQWSVTEEHKGYQLAVCADCGTGFTVNPDYRPERYLGAYGGPDSETPLGDEHAAVYGAPTRRLELELQAFCAPPPRLTPAEKVALQWLRGHSPPGAFVVDCGCGTGRFLRAARRVGLQIMGIDISPRLVEQLQDAGLPAQCGAAPGFLWQQDAPFAITFFEVLEHLAEPARIIGPLKERFPATTILASVPSSLRHSRESVSVHGASEFPPNEFLRWSPTGLRLFFERMGYRRVAIVTPPPAGSEHMPGLGQVLWNWRRKTAPPVQQSAGEDVPSASPPALSRLLITAALWGHRAYQELTDILAAPRAWRARRQGRSGASMLVIGEP
jgi:SAM-dependent methyltransferase